MTTVTIDKETNGAYLGFAVDGHTGYAAAGGDIVCAAVSVLTINTINAIDTLTPDADKAEVNTNETEGILRCRFREPLSEGSTLLMATYELGIKHIAAEYGDEFIRVRIREQGE